ncbi:heme biosynthesis HemY N-terminal domain-containing protein [Chitinasiproducens palmae]|uniref:HemY protein n=1 Tax=Chitinasiproducens palmae TaxID=1770053 RepID=A0A1H2PNY6_9BURK|nr:heme biosynthesis HemY N-terminal domain-containing protein [Chitinasiproducens palmae]SDV47974.1 HemY protein [Chitinasiproducens palmae]
MAMRSLFWLALLFAVAVALAVSGQVGQGHVILVYPPWRLDMSLTFLVVSVIVAFVLVYILVRVLRAVFSLPQRVGAYRERSRDQKAHRALREALGHLFAGRFEKAEKAARQSVEHGRAPEAASLVAARAAQGMREYTRRDEWLARVDGADWQEARWLAAADMNLEAHDAEEAGAALARAEEGGAKRLYVQRLAWRVARRRGDWQGVLNRQKSLDKRDALPPETATRVRQQALEHLLHERRADADALLELWQQLPAADRETPRLADLAAGELVALGRHADAARVVEQALAANWDARLLRRYAECADEDDARAPIQRVEAWQSEHPNDGDLLYALGRLCQRQRLWGKAQASYEQALTHASDARLRYRIQRALGELHEALGDTAAASRAFRAAALALDLR